MNYFNDKINYQRINADIWSNINECLTDKCSPISHEDYYKDKNGKIKVTLAGIKTVPKECFPKLHGGDVLGLACGGQQCTDLLLMLQI